MSSEVGFIAALLSGGIAGTAVDVTLFPLDTLKTRLQSANGFWKAGGFRGVYSGIGSAALGSAPSAALFFCTYEAVKNVFIPFTNVTPTPLVHMAAAATGEVIACIVRVPVEVVKQRTQASPQHSSLHMFRRTVLQEGFLGLYRGYFSTVLREIPFSLIQFPLWEFTKAVWSQYQGRYVDSWQASLCGAFSGGVSAAITTPLDVAKTRIMLAEKGTKFAMGSIVFVLKQVQKEKGYSGLFAGIVPRVMWISIGGAVFLGVYEKSKRFLQSNK